jgi:hypothetical protein
MASKKFKFPKDRFHYIHSLNLHNIIDSVKEAEEKGDIIKVGRYNLSNYLREVTGYAEDAYSLPNLVKKAIVDAADLQSNPIELNPKLKMSGIISEYPQWGILTDFLNDLIDEYDPADGVSQEEVENCETVQDVIDLITKKVNS